MENAEEAAKDEKSILLTLEETAAQLNVSLKSVRGYIKAGLLPVIRLGARTRRVSQSDLDDFINRMRQHNS